VQIVEIQVLVGLTRLIYWVSIFTHTYSYLVIQISVQVRLNASQGLIITLEAIQHQSAFATPARTAFGSTPRRISPTSRACSTITCRRLNQVEPRRPRAEKGIAVIITADCPSSQQAARVGAYSPRPIDLHVVHRENLRYAFALLPTSAERLVELHDGQKFFQPNSGQVELCLKEVPVGI